MGKIRGRELGERRVLTLRTGPGLSLGGTNAEDDPGAIGDNEFQSLLNIRHDGDTPNSRPGLTKATAVMTGSVVGIMDTSQGAGRLDYPPEDGGPSTSAGTLYFGVRPDGVGGGVLGYYTRAGGFATRSPAGAETNYGFCTRSVYASKLYVSMRGAYTAGVADSASFKIGETDGTAFPTVDVTITETGYTPEAAGPGWEPQCLGVSAADLVYAGVSVGTTLLPYQYALLYSWDGTTTTLQRSVHGAAIGSIYWQGVVAYGGGVVAGLVNGAVGTGAIHVRNSSGAWSTPTIPAGTTCQPSGLTGAYGTLCVFSGSVYIAVSGGKILKWDGASLTVARTGLGADAQSLYVFGSYMYFIVGTSLCRFDGTTWQDTAATPVLATTSLGSVGLAAPYFLAELDDEFYVFGTDSGASKAWRTQSQVITPASGWLLEGTGPSDGLIPYTPATL